MFPTGIGFTVLKIPDIDDMPPMAAAILATGTERFEHNLQGWTPPIPLLPEENRVEIYAAAADVFAAN